MYNNNNDCVGLITDNFTKLSVIDNIYNIYDFIMNKKQYSPCLITNQKHNNVQYRIHNIDIILNRILIVGCLLGDIKYCFDNKYDIFHIPNKDKTYPDHEIKWFNRLDRVLRLYYTRDIYDLNKIEEYINYAREQCKIYNIECILCDYTDVTRNNWRLYLTINELENFVVKKYESIMPKSHANHQLYALGMSMMPNDISKDTYDRINKTVKIDDNEKKNKDFEWACSAYVIKYEYDIEKSCNEDYEILPGYEYNMEDLHRNI